MIHKCIALIVLARLSEAVTVANLDARHGSPEVLIGGGLESVARGDWHVYLNADQHTAGLGLTYLGGGILPATRTPGDTSNLRGRSGGARWRRGTTRSDR
jgi:hypothetical protein